MESLLQKEVPKHFGENEGQMGLVGTVIGVMVVAIIVFAAVIPTVVNSISSAGLTGTNKTLADLVPLFIILGILVIIIGAMVVRFAT